jgi:hypothetical protein
MSTLFRARNSFWLAYTNEEGSCLRLMTPELRRFVAERCTNERLVLQVRRDEIKELVARWKHEARGLRMLRYANVQRMARSGLVGGSFFESAWEHRDEWCIKLGGEPKLDDRGVLWMNITDLGFRAAIVEHLDQEVRSSGCDGLAIDAHHWNLGDANVDRRDELNARWPSAAIAVLQELKAALGLRSTILFNGLWGFGGELQAVKQADMLRAADGVLVEFFGVDGHNPAGSATPATEWQLFVGNLNAQLAAKGSHKYAIVNAQRPSGVYATYADDYATALYCYASFLLGPLDPMHGFHYGNVQCTKTDKERAGGYDYFDFQDWRLGSPVAETIEASPGGKARVFEKSIVLVAPTGGGMQRFTLAHRYHTIAGQSVDPGVREVPGGRAEILLTSRPAAPPPRLRVFSGSPSFTEWMVQPVKSGWFRYKALDLKVRSTDSASAILVRVEIDDDPTTHGIIVVRPQGGTFAKTAYDYPYAEDPNGSARNEYASVCYTIENAWSDLSVSLDDEIRTTCHRVVSIRAVGGVQISQITLRAVTPMT